MDDTQNPLDQAVTTIDTLSPADREKLRRLLNAEAEDRAENLADQLNMSTKRIEIPESIRTKPIPDWVKMPAGLVLPKHKQVLYVRFRAGMTDTPTQGERQAIIWSNNLGDQKLGVMRADRDPNKLHEQWVKQMVRAVDGEVVDWGGDPNAPGSIDRWWDCIGPKCRSILDKIYFQLHTASREEAVDFFEDCVAVQVVGG